MPITKIEKSKVRHLFVTDEDGTPAFYLLTDKAFNKWSGDMDSLFQWLSVRSRPGQRRFSNLSSLIEHVVKHDLSIGDEAFSTPAY